MPEARRAEIDVLQCSGCGASVPLGDGDTTVCPQCRRVVAVPPRYGALRDVARADSAARREAARLFDELGRRPTRMERALGLVFHPVALVLSGGSFLLLLFIAVAITALWSVSPLVHANVWDVLPESTRIPLIMVPSAGAFVMGVILGVHGRRRVLSMRALQAALAATPPTEPLGAPQCRVCGAPLELLAGALGATCLYCRADNLVALPADWVAGVKAATRVVKAEIERAAADLLVEQRRIRRSTIVQVSLVLLAIGALVSFSWLHAGATRNRASQDWNLALEDPRVLVRRQVVVPGGRWSFVDTLTLEQSCQGAPTTFAAPECDASGCAGWYYAALRRGERLTLATTGPPADVTVRMHTVFWWPLTPPGDGFGRVVAASLLAPSQDVTVEAPWSAWYQIDLHVSGIGPAVPYPLCVRVE